MKLISYPEIFSHVHTMGKILGMWPFKRVKGRLHFTKLRIAQSFVSSAESFVLTVHFYMHFSSDLMEEFSRARTIQFLIVFRSVSNVLVMVLLMVTNYVYSEQTSLAIVKMQEVDQAMVTSGQKDFLVRVNWKNRKSGNVMLGINLAFNIVCGVLKAITKSHNRVIYFLIATYPRIIISNFNTYFFMLTLMVEDRFRLINSMVLQSLDESIKVRKYPTDSNFSKNVTDLMWWHKNLVDITRKLNEIYNLNVLLCITIDFILLVGDLYITMHALFFDLVYQHCKTVLSLSVNCVFYIVELFYFSKRASDVCNEVTILEVNLWSQSSFQANRTHTLLSGIHIDVDKEEERNTVI